MRSKLLTEKEAADWLRMSPVSLKNMRYRPGQDPIPFTKIGSRVYYREDLVQKWLERNTFQDNFESREHKRAS